MTTDVALSGSGPLGDPDLAMAGELLEGMTFEGCPAFETWLSVERRRLASDAEALLRETALRRLGAGRFPEAVAIAARLVEQNPLDEANQILLVRCMTADGSRADALAQANRCEELFRRELGTTPSAQLRAAAEGPRGSAAVSPARGRASAAAQLEAGQAAIDAGAVDAGLQCLRRAVAEADGVPDDDLRLRARIALGSALIHAVRGRDEEGAAVLHEALAAAEATGEQAAAGPEFTYTHQADQASFLARNGGEHLALTTDEVARESARIIVSADRRAQRTPSAAAESSGPRPSPTPEASASETIEL